jgi:hypothetical protein
MKQRRAAKRPPGVDDHKRVARRRSGRVRRTIQTQQIEHQYRIDGATGTATDKNNVGDQQYTWTGDHAGLFPDDFPDSNRTGCSAPRVLMAAFVPSLRMRAPTRSTRSWEMAPRR